MIDYLNKIIKNLTYSTELDNESKISMILKLDFKIKEIKREVIECREME